MSLTGHCSIHPFVWPTCCFLPSKEYGGTSRLFALHCSRLHPFPSIIVQSCIHFCRSILLSMLHPFARIPFRQSLSKAASISVNHCLRLHPFPSINQGCIPFRQSFPLSMLHPLARRITPARKSMDLLSSPCASPAAARPTSPSPAALADASPTRKPPPLILQQQQQQSQQQSQQQQGQRPWSPGIRVHVCVRVCDRKE